MNYLDELYNIPIKAVSLGKEKHSNIDTHEIFVSQSTDYHFTLADSVNDSEYVTIIAIQPEKLKILKEYVDKAVINYETKDV